MKKAGQMIEHLSGLYLCSTYERKRLKTSNFDFHFYTRRKLELHQGVDSLACSAVDVDKALVVAELELLTALLVNECGTVDSVDTLVRRQWNRTAHDSVRSLHSFYNLLSRLVDQLVVIAFQLDTNLLTHRTNVKC